MSPRSIKSTVLLHASVALSRTNPRAHPHSRSEVSVEATKIVSVVGLHTVNGVQTASPVPFAAPHDTCVYSVVVLQAVHVSQTLSCDTPQSRVMCSVSVQVVHVEQFRSAFAMAASLSNDPDSHGGVNAWHARSELAVAGKLSYSVVLLHGSRTGVQTRSLTAVGAWLSK